MTAKNLNKYNNFLINNKIDGKCIYEMKNFNQFFPDRYLYDILEMIENGNFSFSCDDKYFIWGHSITTIRDDQELERHICNMYKEYPALKDWMENNDNIDNFDIEMLLEAYNNCCLKYDWSFIHKMNEMCNHNTQPLETIKQIDFLSFSIHDKYYTHSDSGIISIADDLSLRDIFEYHRKEIIQELRNM